MSDPRHRPSPGGGSTDPGSPAGRPWLRGDLALIAAAGLFAFLLYAPSLLFGFVNWDDNRYVYGNPLIAPLAARTVVRWFTEFYFTNYAPLTLASLALDHAMWGTRASGYHLTNAVLHGLSCGLFALALRQGGAPRIATAVAALLFAAHPAQVETVAWISQRKALLAMVFMLGAYLAWARATRRPPRPARGAFVAALALFVAALLSKGTVAVLPLVLLLGDRARGRGPWVRLILEQVPFLAAGAAIMWLTRSVWLSDPGIAWATGVGDFSGHLTYTFESIGRYARILLFPTSLTVLYDPPFHLSAKDPWVAAGVLLAAMGALGFLWADRRARSLLPWMGFFWLGLLPVLPLIAHPKYLAERYLHVPLLGIAACAGFGAEALLRRLGTRGRRVLCAAGFGAVILLLTALTLARERVWRDSLSLWSSTVARAPVRWTAHLNLGVTLEERGDALGALRQYELAHERNPEGVTALATLANAWARFGERERAEYALRLALEMPSPDPRDHAFAARSLGVLLESAGRLPEAVSACQEAIRFDRRDSAARLCLARSLRTLGRLPEARLRFEEVLMAEPYNGEALIGLGGVEIDAGRPDRAASLLSRAMREGSPLPEVLLERARMRAKQGHVASARADLDRALDLAPTGAIRERILKARDELGGRERDVPAR